MGCSILICIDSCCCRYIYLSEGVKHFKCAPEYSVLMDYPLFNKTKHCHRDLSVFISISLDWHASRPKILCVLVLLYAQSGVQLFSMQYGAILHHSLALQTFNFFQAKGIDFFPLHIMIHVLVAICLICCLSSDKNVTET